MTIVPRLIVGPDTGTMRALVIAYVPGTARSATPICARADDASPAARAHANAVDRVKRECMSSSLWEETINNTLGTDVPLSGYVSLHDGHGEGKRAHFLADAPAAGRDRLQRRRRFLVPRGRDGGGARTGPFARARWTQPISRRSRGGSRGGRGPGEWHPLRRRGYRRAGGSAIRRQPVQPLLLLQECPVVDPQTDRGGARLRHAHRRHQRRRPFRLPARRARRRRTRGPVAAG